LGFALRTRLRDPRRFRPFNKRMRKNLLKPSLTISRGVSAPIRIEEHNRQIVSKQNKAFVLRVISGPTISNNGDPIQATIPIATR
jgi:hypothetical protein